jgi:hypothetical protein
MVHAQAPVKTGPLKERLAENAAKLARLQTWLEGQQPGQPGIGSLRRWRGVLEGDYLGAQGEARMPGR